MKRRVVVGGLVVVALIAGVVVHQCAGTSTPTTANSSPEGAAGPSRSIRDKHVDPRTLRRGAIAGTVRDAVTKAPLAGARVCGDAESRALSRQVTRDPICTTSDATGAYKLENLVPAMYTIVASVKAYQPGV